MDPRSRLSRPILGDSVVVERPQVLRIAERSVVKEKKELIQAHKEPRKFTVRVTKVRVTPQPNAPQLIRIVRKPYTLDLARGKRVPLEKLSLVKRQRMNVTAELREGLGLLVGPPRRARVTDRPRAGERPRPDLSGWLATAPLPAEEP